ncbi:MAG: hypothetical protein NTW03_11695 [Verrucomicrobia bacterium]|nr:hypothetical protein [Verrucomicrobiota bacterium]
MAQFSPSCSLYFPASYSAPSLRFSCSPNNDETHESDIAEQNHWSESGRAESVSSSHTLGRPHRSVLTFAGSKRMTKRFRDSVSFAVMAALVFIGLSLSFTFLFGSSRTGTRYLHLHWIVLREDLAQVLTVAHIDIGKLLALIALSLFVTWVLSKLLKVLHAKKSETAWLLFILVIVIYFVAAAGPNFVFT